MLNNKINKIYLNKRADIGETMTWIIATLIIIIILILFFFISGILAKYKSFSISKGEIETENNLVVISEEAQFFSSNLFSNKTELALKINSNNQNEILKWIEGEKKYE